MSTAEQEESLLDENLCDTLDPVYRISIFEHGGKVVLPPEGEQTHQHSKSVNFGLESSFMSGFKPLTVKPCISQPSKPVELPIVHGKILAKATSRAQGTAFDGSNRTFCLSS
eukprot:TRINITY_DN3764_c0_g1_i3.p1 TRINITY_DN3764_c0_g1~~TRINITY_DN3764_c0_g1_i3.p1  ORF type:complete len:112 (-),score=17.81 TRINITY_DN3764_c0_g1_i3:82-417(-)